jgi:large subunit ribosomal protein L24
MRKIRKDDEVIVLVGKDKGKRGKVAKILVAKSKAIVGGVNMIKRHTKPNPQNNEPGGIIEKEAAIDLSNIAIFNSETNKADRVGIRVENDKNVRFYKSDNRLIDS